MAIWQLGNWAMGGDEDSWQGAGGSEQQTEGVDGSIRQVVTWGVKTTGTKRQGEEESWGDRLNGNPQRMRRVVRKAP